MDSGQTLVGSHSSITFDSTQLSDALGLVNRVVPDAELRDTAFAMAKSLAEGPAIAFAYINDNLDYAATSDFLTSMEQEADNMARAARTLDHKEAVRAFVEKRKPSFSGIETGAGAPMIAVIGNTCTSRSPL